MVYSKAELQKVIDENPIAESKPEAKKKYSDAELQMIINENPVVEAKPEANFLQGGLTAIQDFGKQAAVEAGNIAQDPLAAMGTAAANFSGRIQRDAEDTFRGTEGLISATGLAKPIPEIPGKTEAETAFPEAFTPEAKKKFSLTSGIAEGAGALLSSLPLFVGGGGVAQGVGRALATHPSPLVSTMVQGLAKMPGAMKDILSLTTQGSGGVFASSLSQAMAKQVKGGHVRGDIAEATKEALIETAKAAPWLVAGAAAFKVAEVAGLSFFKHRGKMREQNEKMQNEQAQHEQKIAEDAYEAKKARYAHEFDAEKQHADMMKRTQEMYQAQIDEMEQAQQFRQQQLQLLEKKLLDNEKFAQQSKKEKIITRKNKQLSVWAQNRDKTMGAEIQKNLMPEEEIGTVEAEIAKLQSEMQNRRSQIDAVRQESIVQNKAYLEQLKARREQNFAGEQKPLAPIAEGEDAELEQVIADLRAKFQARKQAPKRKLPPTTPPTTPPPATPTQAARLGPEWGEPVSGAEVQGYDANPGGNRPRYRQRLGPGYKQPVTVGHPGDTPAEIELYIRRKEADALVKGDTNQLIIDKRRAKAKTAGITDAELQAVTRNKADEPWDASLLLGGGPEAGGIIGAKILAKKIKEKLAGKISWDNAEKLAGSMFDMDYIHQFDPILAEALQKASRSLESIEGRFAETAGKLRFSYGGAGKIDSKILYKGLRGKLSAEERAAIPKDVLKAIDEARGHVREFVEKGSPTLKWLEDQGAAIKPGSDLSNLRDLLRDKISDFKGMPLPKKNALDLFILHASDLHNKFLFFRRPKTRFIHAYEKGATLLGEANPIGFGRALWTAHRPGPYKEFAETFYGNVSRGPVTEAAEETGLQRWLGGGEEEISKPLKFKQTKQNEIADTLSAAGVEESVNSVSAILGLDRAAEAIGYESGEKLAADIVLARKGQGTLATDSDKLWKAMAIIERYVNKITGTNVPGFVNRNALQRNPVAGVMNRFLTARIKQSSNMWKAVRAVFQAKSAGEAVGAGIKLGTTLAGLYVAGGAKSWIPREIETGIRVSNPKGWYHFLDVARAARFGNKFSLEHVQPSISPIFEGGGEAAFIGAREALRTAFLSEDPEKRSEAAVRAAGVVFASEVLQMGGGQLLDYAKAVRDGVRKYEIEKVYQHLMVTGEKHVADVPVETDIPKSLFKAYSGIHMEDDAEYSAAKGLDLRDWVVQNAPVSTLRQGLKFERLLKEQLGIKLIEKIKNKQLGKLKERGVKPSSDEYRQALEKFTAYEAEDNRMVEYYEMRAEMWQHLADRVKPPKETPAPMTPEEILSSSKPGA